MQPLDPSIIAQMREMKAQGESIKGIARTLGCSSSSVSFYCHDLYENPRRKQLTQEAVRKARNERRKALQRAGLRKRYKYPRKRSERATYPCVDCSKQIGKKGGICISCHLARQAGVKAKRQKERELRQKDRASSRFPAPTLDPCSPSPSGAHHWMLDAKSFGVCKHCGKERDFGSEKPRPHSGVTPRWGLPFSCQAGAGAVT